jgi:hypothetical protein
MPDEQMLNQCINPLVSLATQLSIFLKGQVSQPPNPLSFSKRRDGIGVKLVKLFAHSFVVVVGNKCTDARSATQPCARTLPRASCSIH